MDRLDSSCKRDALNFILSFLWTESKTNYTKGLSKSNKANPSSKWKKLVFILSLLIGVQYFGEILFTVSYKTGRLGSVKCISKRGLNIGNIKGQLFSYKSFLKWRSRNGTNLPWHWLAGYTTKYANNVPLCLRNNSELVSFVPPKNETSLKVLSTNQKEAQNLGIYLIPEQNLSMPILTAYCTHPQQAMSGQQAVKIGFDRFCLGPTTVNKTLISLRWAEINTAGVQMGGIFAPKHCRTRHKVAILIPYRDREDNLPVLLYHLHKLLKKQHLDYAVFVIEQSQKDKFNKGSLYNTGFMVTQLLANWTCLIFHDVDLVPLDERILYTCPRRPTHMSTSVESWGFRMAYRFLFGGVTAMKPEVYENVNGYSNYYWDWGAEDDDMLRRLRYTRHSIYKISQAVGRYATLSHKPNRINPKKFMK